MGVDGFILILAGAMGSAIPKMTPSAQREDGILDW
jgi:hypothetical protein